MNDYNHYLLETIRFFAPPKKKRVIPELNYPTSVDLL